MSKRRRYRKKAGQFVTAVRLDLDTDGFTYHKWGASQRCKQGDWLVENDGDTYTVDAAEFARTYRQRSPGVFEKAAVVWARVADDSGFVTTREGKSRYAHGDYLLADDEQGPDTYCMSADKFEAMYEAVS